MYLGFHSRYVLLMTCCVPGVPQHAALPLRVLSVHGATICPPGAPRPRHHHAGCSHPAGAAPQAPPAAVQSHAHTVVIHSTCSSTEPCSHRSETSCTGSWPHCSDTCTTGSWPHCSDTCTTGSCPHCSDTGSTGSCPHCRDTVYTMSGFVGKVVASHAEGCLVDSRLRLLD